VSTLNVLIIITIICWGIWGILDKKALEGSNSRDVLLMLYSSYIIQLPIFGLWLNATLGWHLKPELFYWTGIAAVTYTVAAIAYLTAMDLSEASYVLGITASYPIILQFLAVLVLGEQLVFMRIVGAALIGLGVFAIGFSGEKSQQNMDRRQRTTMITCVILATLCWGCWGLFDKKALALGQPLEVYFVQILWDLVLLIIVAGIFRMQGHKPNLRLKRPWLFALLSATCIAIGAWTYLCAMSISTASYVIVITGCYPLLMYLFALLFLKEKFNRIRFAGIALVVFGGILVQLTQAA
jgi:drug/metabolite transporter (DMT)-like permease